METNDLLIALIKATHAGRIVWESSIKDTPRNSSFHSKSGGFSLKVNRHRERIALSCNNGTLIREYYYLEIIHPSGEKEKRETELYRYDLGYNREEGDAEDENIIELFSLAEESAEKGIIKSSTVADLIGSLSKKKK